MKIIDFEKKGNVVRFYLGRDDCEDFHGDDWNDTPYECNAGGVYDRFVVGHADIAFPYDMLVLEPCDGEFNSRYCKDDMKTGNVPCLIVVPAEQAERSYYDSFSYWLGCKDIQMYYFNDPMQPTNGLSMYEVK